MERFFNIAGPNKPELNFTLDPLRRIHLEEVLGLIEQQRYFILHAPRQTGKTTALLALMAHLNAGERYRALYVNVETAQTARNDVKEGISAIVRNLVEMARFYLGDEQPDQLLRDVVRAESPHDWLRLLLQRWSAADRARPVVLLIDEIDALVGDVLISVLRQLRSGYAQRPAGFPQTVILCGVRDVRDYRIRTSANEIITGGSAFNIKTESIRVGNFSQADVSELYAQYSAETGQGWTEGAMDRVWDLTQGQPWLVNAVAREVTEKIRPDRSGPITEAHILEAKERLILARATHLDQLADKLREPRVRSVIEPVLAGTAESVDLPDDDLQYVYDLGLIVLKPQVSIANELYREVIPRQLTWSTQHMLAQDTAWYVRPDGGLDLAKLLTAFQDFFRQHSEHWVERFDYKEAGPQLLLQAFLQRVVNGGGRIEREYGLGRGRTDLYLEWYYGKTLLTAERTQRVVLELKLQHHARETVIAEGLAQTAAYAERCGADDAHLLIFDRRPAVAWDDKIFRETQEYQGRRITVWGM